jgi:hypothetical protein
MRQEALTKKGEFMTITGRFEADSNFITVYADNTIYTFPLNSREWGCLEVPGYAACGGLVTLDLYHKWESECAETGTFEVGDHGWKRIR